MDTISQHIPYSEVKKHVSKDSCWVILYGSVWDVTSFLPLHPGGSQIILSLAGTDASEEFDPIHPPGTLEEYLESSARLGTIDSKTLQRSDKPIQEFEGTEIAQRSTEVPIKDMLNLNEIEEAATRKLSKKAWAYFFSASDDLISKSLNSTTYQSIFLRPRVFVDCSRCDTTTTFLGHKLSIPIYVSPAAMARLAHPDGEWGIAQACKSFKTMQLISNFASMQPEKIVEDAGPDQIFGWQLYVQRDRAKSESMLARVEKLDAIKFICLTLDSPVASKREDDERSKRVSEKRGGAIEIGATELKEGVSVSESLWVGPDSTLTWQDTLSWLGRHTSKPVVLKGIQTHDDFLLATRHTDIVKGVILSNHGGRALDTAPPAIHTLLEIHKFCPEALSKLDILVDGGIKRGTDVVKALALGAKAVGIGRGPLFGLAAGGIPGVKRVLEILRDETATSMRLLGCETVPELGPHCINTSIVERDIYNGSLFDRAYKIKSRI